KMENPVQLTKIFKRVACILPILAVCQSALLGQLREDLRNEILVYITTGALVFPAGERGALTPEQLTIPSQALRQAIDRSGVATIAKAFPDFSDSDTIRVTDDGKTVKIPQFSRIFRVRVQQVADVDSAIATLSRLPVVLFAEKNMDAYPGVNDADYGKQWHLHNTGQGGGSSGADIDAEAAWAVYNGSTSIKIGVIVVSRLVVSLCQK
ncbi:unnamed protein product, partial [marine sediment metagenome]